MYRCLIPIATVVLFVSCSSETAKIPPRQNQAITPVRFVRAQTDDKQEKAAKAEFDAMQAKYQDAVKELRALISQTDSKDEQVELLATKNPAPEFSKQFMAHAKKHIGTKASMDSTLFVVGQTSGELKNEAMSFLLENYADKVKLSSIASSLKSEVPHPDMETWFELMIKNAKSDAVKANVMLSYSQYVSQIPFFRRSIELNPHISDRLPKNQLDYISTPRTESQNKKHETILQNLIDQYGDLKVRGATYRDVATGELFELTRLQVGMVAPEIEGNDLDDIPFKLSDYRGKLVMLDFWGHWCPPCRAMYGHEQQITKSLADKPFVLIGVNSDGKKDVAIDAVRSESLSWRHFWNGPEGTRGPISTTWNVVGSGWPTVYLIDENGVIRYKEVLGEDIDRGIEKLMAEMGHNVNLSDAAE